MPELRFGPSATPPVLGLMDSAQFHASAYDAVRSIPLQRVTTYGHIARLIGMPNHARQVGQGEVHCECERTRTSRALH